MLQSTLLKKEKTLTEILPFAPLTFFNPQESLTMGKV